MSTSLERDFTLPFPAAKVSEAMRSPALIEESERSRGARSVDIRTLVKTDAQHEYEIHTRVPAKTVKGLDPNKLEDDCVIVRWRLTDQVRSWQYAGPHKNMVDARGEDRLIEANGSTTIRFSMKIDVKIPLAGKLVAKMVASGFEENWPKYVRLIEKHCA